MKRLNILNKKLQDSMKNWLFDEKKSFKRKNKFFGENISR